MLSGVALVLSGVVLVLRGWLTVCLGIGAFLLGLAALDREMGIGPWWKLRSELVGARERVAALERENAGLENQIAALEGDPFEIERAIREDLELARPGELVVRFERDPLGLKSGAWPPDVAAGPPDDAQDEEGEDARRAR